MIYIRMKEAASQNLLNMQGRALSIYFAGMKLHPHFARITEEVGEGVALKFACPQRPGEMCMVAETS